MTYAYRKKFYVDVDSMDIAVMPKDMILSGQGLTRISTDEKQNFSIYRSAPIKAGTEVTWTFSGGTAPSVPEAAEAGGGSAVESRPDFIRSKALVIGPLLLMGFVLVLWVAFNRMPKDTPKHSRSPDRRFEEPAGAIVERNRRSWIIAMRCAQSASRSFCGSARRASVSSAGFPCS